MLVANGKRYTLSHHAETRRRERDIPLRWIKRIIEDPDSVDTDWRDNDTYFAFLKSKSGHIYPIKVIVDEYSAVIVTVMFTG